MSIQPLIQPTRNIFSLRHSKIQILERESEFKRGFYNKIDEKEAEIITNCAKNWSK